MILDRLREFQSIDSRIVWNSMRRFQNVGFLTDNLIELHRIPSKQKDNAKKQAEQIRFCLLQAEEYFEAARAVSPATKPVLLYYGVMSLALAEVLFKQSGASSLDSARGENAHHGLTFSLSGRAHRTPQLDKSAAMLRASPLIKNGGRRVGTFDLWHRTSRRAPAIALGETHDAYSVLKAAKILVPTIDTRPPPISANGFSLYDCFVSHPGMRHTLDHIEDTPCLVRARLDEQTEENGNRTIKLIAQPGSKSILEKFKAMIEFHPELVDRVSLIDLSDGFFLNVELPSYWGKQLQIVLPNSIQISVDEIFFCVTNPSLNEFGVLYFGAYTLGNYARYHPDAWMVDVEKCSDLATASEVFISLVEERTPLLTLSELSQSCLLLERRSGAQ